MKKGRRAEEKKTKLGRKKRAKERQKE